MTTDHTAWLRQYYADWDSGDLEAITSWFDEDVVLEDVPTGHVAHGAAEARTFVSGALKMAPGASYEVERARRRRAVRRRVGDAAGRSARRIDRHRPQRQGGRKP